jgi:CheY-like chemotaxis protein
MLRLVLESSGAHVTSVDRSQKAVEELGKNKFDVMISDLGLPGMDGHDLIREVRGQLGIDADQLPAIALSGYVADDDRHRSLSNGFQMHLQKPLDISTLASTIRSLLDQTNRKNSTG